MWLKFWQKIVRFIDPKLEKYRVKREEPVKKLESPKYTPRTLADFVGVVQRTPKSVLSTRDRKRIAAVMSFDERTVGDLMVPRSKMIFVGGDEMLGPLVLDKLYKLGFMDFPVMDAKGKVKGIINTEALNALEIRKMEKAEKYVDENVRYLHENDLLSFAVEEIRRTNGHYYLVRGEREELVGFFTLQMLLDYFVV